MTNKVWVYIDQFNGQALPVSWEAIAAGRSLAEQLGGGVTAVVFGQGVEGAAQAAFQYGVDEVIIADDPTLSDYRAEPYTTLLAKLAEESSPDVILFPTTGRARELAAMTAIDLESGVLADVVTLDVDGGAVVATRPVYGGKALAKVTSEAKPQIITVRGRIFKSPTPDESKSGTLTRVDAALAEDDIKTRVLEYVETGGGVSVTDASVIVTGGRGVSNYDQDPPGEMDDEEAEAWRAQQGFNMFKELADLLGGAVGATRAAVDAGYITYEHQIGQTGKIVSPDLYIAAGASGAIQHLAGMRNSKLIVAINDDEDAPIFTVARYGVEGDLYDILPPLIEAFRKRLG